MSLHKEAIEWIARSHPNAINNHYDARKRVGKGTPDVIVKNGELLEYHEVEVVNGKPYLYEIQNAKKVLWVVVPSIDVYDEIIAIGNQHNYKQLKVEQTLLEKKINRIEQEIHLMKDTYTRALNEKKLMEATIEWYKLHSEDYEWET